MHHSYPCAPLLVDGVVLASPSVRPPSAGTACRGAAPASLVAARGVKRYESRTVRLGGPDSPPIRLEFVQRRCCLWWFCRIELRTVRYWRADGPLLESGRSAVETRNLSRDDVVSGGVRRVELRTVRYWRADSPPYSLEFCPETLSSLVELAK